MTDDNHGKSSFIIIS